MGRKTLPSDLLPSPNWRSTVIPQDPTRAEYRQGNARGDEHKHWFRAKLSQQYRLFFRYHASSKVILFAWVNDDDTKRAHESGDDVYRIFRNRGVAWPDPECRSALF